MPKTIADAGWRLDNSYARLPDGLFARTSPVPVRAPHVVILNEPLAVDLGLAPELLGAAGSGVLSGNELPPGAEPIAQAYAGHQFGHFTNLGDGRAILIGEQIDPRGRRFDLQLKGSGRTPFSRGGDGRAALGPMLREFIISEAMHALGLPTTRSLAVTATGESIMRNSPLPGAVLTRVAASHIRVGTFQYAAAVGDPALSAALLDHSVARHEPQLAGAADRVTAFLAAVMERQAALVARWMLVGFVHGVMNTDNMAVSGETIDYGPCAFMDAYDPATVFSSIDHQGRYAYGNQPAIAHWNLARLAESLLPLLPGPPEAAAETLQGVLAAFPERFAAHHLAGARAKLGLTSEEDEDRELFSTLLAEAGAAKVDFTATFASLTAAARAGRPPGCAASEGLGRWQDRWWLRVGREPGGHAAAAEVMAGANPVVIPRNHRVEESLAAAENGDLGPLRRLLAVLRHPYVETAENEPYRGGPPCGTGPYRTFCGT
jgi:uncharacterized protein YdiU (UPF0061 family)